jgi:Fic family protein
MSNPETNIHVLDAAYKPFPTFAEWASRTSVDTVRWDRYNASLKNRPELSPEILNRAREIAKRFAALDTGAIEGLYEVDRGFTYTVAFETAAWEVELAKKGENVRPLFEAQLHAYDYVLDLATKAEPISEAAIRVLHEVVCRAQATYRVMTAVGPQEQELTKGRYKVLPNHVRTRDGVDHSYAPVDVTPPEMARLVGELRSEAFLAAHPVLQAAYAHYALVVIHPFADGNGRVARALASAFTYRAISMPIVILSEHKEAYLDSLEAADKGDLQSFVGFMLARSLDTIQLVGESLRGTLSPTPDEGATAINSLFVTKGGYTQEQVDEAGDRLFQLLQGEAAKIIAKNAGPNLRGSTSPIVMRDRWTAPGPEHRLPAGGERRSTFLHIEFTSSPPALARVYRNYGLWVPIDASGDDDIQVVRLLEEPQGTGNQLGFPFGATVDFGTRMDDLVPAASGILQIRVGLFAEKVAGEMLAELKSLAEKALRGQT